MRQRFYHWDWGYAYTFKQYLLMRLFPFIAKASWGWKRCLGKKYCVLRRLLQNLYYKNGFKIHGYLEGKHELTPWIPQPKQPENWTTALVTFPDNQVNVEIT